MKIPKKVKIGQFTYQVKFISDELRDDDGHRLFGQSRHATKEIILDKNAGQTQVEETFIHEVIHCLDAVYKFSDKDISELIIERMGTSLHQFILQNKEVFETKNDNNLLK